MKKKPINTNQPLVSIITPLFNAESFIEETIVSVQNQVYSNWEQLIVDDKSSDLSVAIVKRFIAKEPRIKLIELEKNKGAAFCRNKATELAKGDYIAFLDSDDTWHELKLKKQIDFMEDNNCEVSFTSYLHVDEEGNTLNKRIVAIPELAYKKQHRNNYIGNLTGIYKAKALDKIMAPNIRKRQDWAVWLEAIKRSGKPAKGIREDLAYYRVRKNSISSNKLNLVKYNFRFYRNYLSYSWIKSVLCLVVFFWEYFIVRPKHIQRLKE